MHIALEGKNTHSVLQQFPSLHSGLVQNCCIATPTGCKPHFISGGFSSRADLGSSSIKVKWSVLLPFPKGLCNENHWYQSSLPSPSPTHPRLFWIRRAAAFTMTCNHLDSEVTFFTAHRKSCPKLDNWANTEFCYSENKKGELREKWYIYNTHVHVSSELYESVVLFTACAMIFT